MPEKKTHIEMTQELEGMLEELVALYEMGMGSADITEVAYNIADYLLEQEEGMVAK